MGAVPTNIKSVSNSNVTSFFTYGMWNPLKLAMYMAAHDQSFYAKAGGNLSLYQLTSTQQANQPSGMPTGPEELLQEQDARIVATYLLNHVNDTLAEELALGLYVYNDKDPS